MRMERGLTAWIAFLAAASGCDSRKPLPPGEYTSVAPDVVRTFEYETPQFHLLAHRFADNEAFRVVVQRPNEQSVRQCRADQGFNKMLERFESLRIRRRIDGPERESIGRSAHCHRLRYTTEPPMEPYEEVLCPTKTGHLMVESDGFAYELDVSTKLIDQLGSACR